MNLNNFEGIEWCVEEISGQTYRKYAQPGTRVLVTNGILDQYPAAKAEGPIKTVIMTAGGNDVIRFTSEAALRRHITAVVGLARQKAARVVLMPCGNVGHAPFFMPPLSWVISRRSNRLHTLVQEISAARNAHYVRLLKPRDEDPFVARRTELHAADGLHPSDAGYRTWWRELVAQGGLAGLDG